MMHNSEPYAKVQHLQFVWYIGKPISLQRSVMPGMEPFTSLWATN